jgi:hypothetical protein
MTPRGCILVSIQRGGAIYRRLKTKGALLKQIFLKNPEKVALALKKSAAGFRKVALALDIVKKSL